MTSPGPIPRTPSRLPAIEVRVGDLVQLFSSFDPSPFHEKELDAAAEEYIVSSAKELPSAAPLTLVVYLDQPVGASDEAQILGAAVREHFARRAEMLRRELRRLLRRGWFSFAIGLGFLVLSVVVGQELARRFGYGPLATVLRESLVIGGWVALWRPMEILLYQYWEHRAEQKVYERLGRARVEIVHRAAEPPQRPPGSDRTPVTETASG